MRPIDARLMGRMTGSRLWLVLVVGAGVAGSALSIFAAWVLSHVLADAVQHHLTLAAAMPALLMVAGLALGRGAAMWFSERAGHAGARRIILDLRARLLRALANGGPALVAGRRTGAVVAASKALDSLDVYFAQYLPHVVLGTTIPAMVLVFLVANDPVSAAIVAVTLPLIPLFMWLIGSAAQHRIDSRWRLLQRLAAYFLDIIQGLPTLRIFGRADAQVQTIHEVTDAARRATMGTLSVAFLSALVLETLASLATAMVAAAIGLRLVNGTMTLQMGFAVLLVVPEAYMPLRRLGAFFHSSKEGLAAATTVMDLIDEVPTNPVPSQAARMPAHSTIEFADVTCIHGERGEGIRFPVSVSIAPGSTTLVCGPSGAGKSTVLAMLLGFVPCTSGTIRVGASSLSDVDLDEWRRHIGWVPQRPSLFPGTILDNLRLSAPATSDEAAATVLERLFPEGGILPSTPIVSNGDGLSGGETMRVALARALVRRPSLLLLDEPTTFLDPRSASAVLGALREFSGTTTLIIATHEPERFPWADTLVNLEVPDGMHWRMGA